MNLVPVSSEAEAVSIGAGALQRLAAFITDQLVVTSLSGQKIEWAHLSDHDATNATC